MMSTSEKAGSAWAPLRVGIFRALWIAALVSMNAAIQLFLPAWVRARGLSVYQIVFFGAQAAGALLWGLIAGPLGLMVTFLLAAAVMVAGVVTIRLWPLFDTSGIDRSLAVYW